MLKIKFVNQIERILINIRPNFHPSYNMAGRSYEFLATKETAEPLRRWADILSQFEQNFGSLSDEQNTKFSALGALGYSSCGFDDEQFSAIKRNGNALLLNFNHLLYLKDDLASSSQYAFVDLNDALKLDFGQIAMVLCRLSNFIDAEDTCQEIYF